MQLGYLLQIFMLFIKIGKKATQFGIQFTRKKLFYQVISGAPAAGKLRKNCKIRKIGKTCHFTGGKMERLISFYGVGNKCLLMYRKNTKHFWHCHVYQL